LWPKTPLLYGFCITECVDLATNDVGTATIRHKNESFFKNREKPAENGGKY
jgi:hypothetical protein